MKVTNRKIGTIREYDNNPRRNDSAVDAVADSIRQFGFRQPIVVDEAGVVIVGHTRLKAARKLGMDTVPVHVAVGLTEEQARAYRLADNRTADFAEWDMEALAAELDGIEMDLSGFDFEGLLEEAGRFDVSETDTPELASGDRSPFQQMTFTLSDDQAETVKSAMDAAKKAGPFVDTGNENSNGNALARIAEAYHG